MKRSWLVVSLVSLEVALGCTRATEPYPGVGGVWQYSSNLVFPPDFNPGGEPPSCRFQGTLTFGQTGSTFQGSYSRLSLMCTSSNASSLSGSITGGTVTADGHISFDLHLYPQPFQHTGIVAGTVMSGTIVDSTDAGNGPEAASGTWTATKQ